MKKISMLGLVFGALALTSTGVAFAGVDKQEPDQNAQAHIQKIDSGFKQAGLESVSGGLCEVEKGTLKENLKAIIDQYNAPELAWGMDKDIAVEFDAVIGGDMTYAECLNVIISSLQKSGAPIAVTIYKNATVIEGR